MEDNNKIKSLETHGRKVDEQIQIFMKKLKKWQKKRNDHFSLQLDIIMAILKTTTGAKQQRGNEATTQFLMGLI
jgi:hypothetical protein